VLIGWEDSLTGNHTFATTVPSDSTGNYSITVPSKNAFGQNASYALFFKYEGTGPYVDQYLADPYPDYSATTVTTTPGGTTVANKTMVAPAAIKGTVSLGVAGQTAPMGSVEVSYIQSVGSALITVPESAPVSVDANGHYSLDNLPPAHYMLHFTYAGAGSYQSKWYTVANGDGSGLYGENIHEASVIGFTGGSDLTQDFVVPPLRTVTGHVYLGSTAYSAGAGQVALSYYYFDANVTGFEHWVTTTVTTDSSGDFSLPGLVDGFYGLRFDATGASTYQEGESSEFEVGATPSPTIRVTLIHLITVSGHVDLNDNTNANPTSAPANSVKVTIERNPGQVWAPFNNVSVLVDSNGNYSIPNIPDFTSYTLGFRDNVSSQCTTIQFGRDCDYPDQYLGGAPVDSQAQFFLTNGSDYVIPDFTMQFANELVGSVKSTGGTPLAGIVLDAVAEQLHSGTTPETGTAVTDASGNFLIRGLPDGSYHFVILPNGTGYLGKTLGSFSLSGGGLHAGYNETLSPANQISGKVTADGGTAVADIAVHAEREDPNTHAQLAGYDTTTAADGTYSFMGLTDGYYEVDFVSSSDQYAFQAYDDQSIFYYPNLISATGGASITAINAAMHPVGAISGVVTVKGGNAADIADDSMQAQVQVYDAATSSWVDTYAYYNVLASVGANRYTIPYLAPDSYRVRIDYFGQDTGNNATFVSPPMTVTAGKTTTYNTPLTVTGPYSTDSSIDSITGSKNGVSVSGWAVFPGSDDSTKVGVAVNIGAGWYGLTANKPNAEVSADESDGEVDGISANHGFSGTIAVAPGTYNACIWVTEPTGPATNIGCQTVTVPLAGATIAKTDSVTVSSAGVTVSGYALYPDNDAASVSVAVNIGSTWYGFTADQHSEEGASDVPGASVKHGFVGTIALAPGTYSACVWVTEPTGPAVNTGCHTVMVPVPPRTSFHLDSMGGVATGISLAGFALYPGSPAASASIALNIGSAWYGLSANQPNSDSGAGTNHGFAGTIALAPGTYNACVWTTEPTGPAVNTGCDSVVVPQRPRTVASFDAPTGTAAGISVSGYAVFPDSFGAAVGIAINIGSGWYGFTANQTNANVAMAVPGADANHGFSGTIPMAPGTYNACLWVTEPTGGAVNNHCHSVVVPVPPRTVAVIDSVTGTGAGATVSGYAVYPGNLNAAVGIALNIGSGWYGITANKASAEAATAYPTSTVGHGFSGTMPIAPGTYSVCTWVTEPSGPAVNVGCQSVVVPQPRRAVFSLDRTFDDYWAVDPGGNIFATGYAVWPDSLATQVPIALQINSSWLGYVAHESNSAGSDEAEAAVPGEGPGHGFDVGSGSFAPGSYKVCMWIAEPSGPAVNAGCHTVVIHARIPAVVSTPSITGSSAGVSVSGYAIYPDAVGWGVALAVNIGSSWIPITANQYNSSGIAAVPGAYGVNGYSGTVAEPPGTYNACVWVAEPAGGAVNTGCSTVTVP
jgi:hypothetical protein